MSLEVAILVIMLLIFVFSIAGYFIYAHSKGKWPFKPYERSAHPPGTQKTGKVIDVSQYMDTRKNNIK